jgi:hypothetical protein
MNTALLSTQHPGSVISPVTLNPLFANGDSASDDKIHELCTVGPETVLRMDELNVAEREAVNRIRANYRQCRVMAKYGRYFQLQRPTTEDDDSDNDSDLVALWNQQPVEFLLGNRNLPPLINHKAIDPRSVRNLNLTTDIAGNLGGICFIVGSFAFYDEYDSPTIGSALFALGSLLFFIGSCANFVKNDAWSGNDMGLTINACLYMFANFLFIIGSVAFVPAVEGELGGNGMGISLFIIGSVIFIVAPSYDMYRAQKLRDSTQISHLSFLIELVIAVLYIGGSCLFVVGSVYFFPALYHEYAVTMFVVGSFCFFAATISSPLANFWRYVTRVTQVEKFNQVSKWAEENQMSAVDVLFGNRNLPPLINLKAIDPKKAHVLTLITDISGNVGGLCFIVGSFAFYSEYDSPTIGSILFALGSLLFFIGSCANFVKNDAWSATDKGLTINACLYMFANFLFIIGSIAFVPAVEEELGGTDLGISLFIIGSVIFIVAPSYDMYRAQKLRAGTQISYLSFVIESTIAALYIGGSCLFVVGSVYFFPVLYHEYAVTMFVVGSFCFFFATVSSPLANIWRYMNTEDNAKLEVKTASRIKRRQRDAKPLRTKSIGRVKSTGHSFFSREAGDLTRTSGRAFASRAKNASVDGTRYRHSTGSADFAQKKNESTGDIESFDLGASFHNGIELQSTVSHRYSEGGYHVTSPLLHITGGGALVPQAARSIFRMARSFDTDIIMIGSS